MVKRKKKKVKKRLVHRRTLIPETMIINTIVNIPLHPETGLPILKHKRVEERKKVRKGWHMRHLVILDDQRSGGYYLRDVIS